MDRKIALRWARALESGKYQHAAGPLRRADGYSCLGVLVDVYVRSERPENAEELLSCTYLPDEVLYWADMRSNWGQFEHPVYVGKTRGGLTNRFARNLVDINDGWNGEGPLDFAGIAAVIRAHSEEL